MENTARDKISAKVMASVSVTKTDSGECAEDNVAIEVPVALAYNGVSHTVMMCSPMNVEDFALGFSLAEGIIPDASHMKRVDVREAGRGIVAEATISEECFEKLKDRRRSALGRSGCGICNTDTISEAVREFARVPFTQTFDMNHYRDAMSRLHEVEVLGGITGCTHAAVWVDSCGNMLAGVEDVGRHVALDKLLGIRARKGLGDGALVLSSRASYEMVGKAAACGIEIMFAVSAPTALAIEVADKTGITLCAFCRGGRANVYTHPERLKGFTS